MASAFNQSEAKLHKRCTSRFQRDATYYNQYLAQQLPPSATFGYAQCMASNPDAPPLSLWVDHVLGNIVHLKVLLGTGQKEGLKIASNNLEIVSKPQTLERGSQRLYYDEETV